MVWHGLFWLGLVWFGLVGSVCFDVARSGGVRFGSDIFLFTLLVGCLVGWLLGWVVGLFLRLLGCVVG